MDEQPKKRMGRPITRPNLVHLHISITASANRLFRKHIGPNRILAREIERALLEDVKRGPLAR